LLARRCRMSDSTTPPRHRKPNRPKKADPDFPLTPHASGAWQQKIRGKIYYFGKWARRINGKLERVPGDGWEEALALYKSQADDLHAGRTPRVYGFGPCSMTTEREAAFRLSRTSPTSERQAMNCKRPNGKRLRSG